MNSACAPSLCRSIRNRRRPGPVHRLEHGPFEEHVGRVGHHDRQRDRERDERPEPVRTPPGRAVPCEVPVRDEVPEVHAVGDHAEVDHRTELQAAPQETPILGAEGNKEFLLYAQRPH